MSPEKVTALREAMDTVRTGFTVLPGPSDDPDYQSSVALAFRHQLVTIQMLASPILCDSVRAELNKVSVDPNSIYDVYDAIPILEALLFDVDEALSDMAADPEDVVTLSPSPGSPGFPHDPNGPAATFAACVARLAATGVQDLAAALLGAHHVYMRPSGSRPEKTYKVQLTLHDAERELVDENRETIENAFVLVSGFEWAVETKPVSSDLVRLRRQLNEKLSALGLPTVLDVRYRDRPGGGRHNVAVHRSTTDWEAIRETDDLLFRIGRRQTAWVQQFQLAEAIAPMEASEQLPESRPTVFVSYSVADEAYKDELLQHLSPLGRRMANIWSFRDIEAGDDHHEQIATHLEKATFGILLISSKFLASDYIADVELPKLQNAGKRLFAVIVGECDHAEITEHLYAPWGLQPLKAMPGEADRDTMYTDIARHLRQALSSQR